MPGQRLDLGSLKVSYNLNNSVIVYSEENLGSSSDFIDRNLEELLRLQCCCLGSG